MSIEAMKQALEALDEAANVLTSPMFADAAAALHEAIEQAEKQGLDQKLSDQSLAIRTRQYANGAQAGWNLAIAGDSEGLRHLEDFARAIEKKLKEKNEAT